MTRPTSPPRPRSVQTTAQRSIAPLFKATLFKAPLCTAAAIVVVLFVLSAPAHATNILGLDTSATSRVITALNDLGYSATVTDDPATFNALLTNGTDWSAVFVDSPITSFDTIPLANYVSLGGRVFVHYGDLELDPGLQTALGIASATDVVAPQTIYAWDPGHPIFNIVHTITQIDPAVGSTQAFGSRFIVLPGDLDEVGGYTPTPTLGEAGVLVSPDSRRVIIGLDFDNMDATQAAQFAQNGVGVVMGLGGCVPIDIFSCTVECSTQDVLIDWAFGSGGSPPTSIEVFHNGTLIPSGWGSMPFRHNPGPGSHSYRIDMTCAATSETWICECKVAVDPRYIIVRGERPQGTIDSVAAIAAALDSLGAHYQIVDSLDDVSCLDSSRKIFFAAGTFPHNHVMTMTEGETLVNHILSGGSLYYESADLWGMDPITPFADYDGVHQASASNGDDSFLGMTGLDYNNALLAGMDAAYNQDQPFENDSTDRLVPADDPVDPTGSDAAGFNAGLIWIDDGTGGDPSAYGTGVFYDTNDGFGKVLVQSWEFGGYGGDQIELLLRYCEALEAPPKYMRGDPNLDGSVDLGDGVYLLNSLFVSGPISTCEDAGDVNDDGVINIADPITILQYLFEGGPPPPHPFPACGGDTNADGLDCEDTGSLVCP